MMSRRSRQGVVALSLLLLISLWATRQEQEQDGGPIEGLDTRLDYALSNFIFHYYDVSGAPAVVMRAPRFTSDTVSGQGEVTNPRLQVRHEGYLWNIIADSALVTSDRERIHLAGEVQLRREGGDPDDWVSMVGSEVSIEVNPRRASSQQPVDVSDRSGRLAGTGFSVDMRSNEFSVENDVRGIYVIE